MFTCQTDFLEADAGSQTFHAFVNARIFGVPVPASLEVAPDGKASVQVTTSSPTGDVRGAWRSQPNGFAYYTDSSLQEIRRATLNFTLAGAPGSASGPFTFDDGIHGGTISITVGALLDPACGQSCGYLLDFQMTLSDGTALATNLARYYFEPSQVIDLNFGPTTTDTHGHVWPSVALLLGR